MVVDIFDRVGGTSGIILGHHGRACGHAEGEDRESEPKHRRQFALGVGPQRQ
jgi:hypothetical protein